MEQQSFASLAYDNKKKKTRREIFLQEMDKVIPWKLLSKPIKKHYPKDGNGRRPYPLETMLRIYFMQQWYQLSDPAMEDSLYDIESVRRFAGLDLEQAIPDETTVLNFRRLLEKHNLTTRLFEQVAGYLEDNGLLLNAGTIVDATIVNAPSSTKNQEKQRDVEMKQTKKGNQWFFGMKAHVGTDTQGRAHSVVVTDASVHDSQILDDLLHGEEEVLYGDKAYADEKKKQDFEAEGKTWRINRKAKRGKKLNIADRSFNKKSNRTRAKVEHLFGVIKNLWNYRKVRYKGLSKNAAQVFSLMALANLYLARHDIAQLQA
jgi:IS5 family transposase